MLASFESRAFFAVLVFTCLAALIRGGWRERAGAGLFVAAWAASVLSQFLGVGYTPLAQLGVIDSLLFLGLVWLAWKSPSAWPVLAAGLQAVALSLHAAFALKLDLNARAYIIAINVIGYLQMIALIWGSLSRRNASRKNTESSA
ncbi:MAG: hypothetical protein ACXW3D_04895 [Caulobacteraceae bacterium]